MKTRVKILWAIVFCGLMSCSHDERVPQEYIGMKEMGSILLNMQMADAYNDSYIPDTARRPESREKRIKTLYLQVLMLHHTNKEAFLKSYHFYEQHPDLMKKIYAMMQSSINKKSAHADSVRERKERLLHPVNRGIKGVKNFLFPSGSIIEGVLPKPKVISKPKHYEHLGEPDSGETIKGKQDFLFPYQPVIDSVLPKPKRVFKPDNYDHMKEPPKPLKVLKKK